jgi:hypothetical protein
MIFVRLCHNASMDVKVVGASGQVSLGKKYAGRTVIVDQLEEGVWMIKTAQVIPDNERWLHTPEMDAKLDEAFAWSAQHPAQASDLDEIERKLKAHLKKRAPGKRK